MNSCTIFRTAAALSVFILGTCFSAGAADKPAPADIIIYNAKVLTVDSNFAVAQAIAVRGDKIEAVGKESKIEKLKDLHTRLIDAHGKTILPGLFDNHVCSFAAAVHESNTSPAFTSIAEALTFIRTQAKEKSNGWIIIERTYPTRLKENRLPTKVELDAASPKLPVFWDCGNVAVVNSKALEISKITRDTAVPFGGEVMLDPDTRQPNGVLRNASNLLKLPPAKIVPKDTRREALKQLYALYNQQGITSIGERHADTNAIDLFRELGQSNELTLRIVCGRYLDTGSNLDDALAHLDALTNVIAGGQPCGPTGTGDDWVRIGALDLAIDGDIQTGTAYLRTPWGMGPTYQIIDPAYRGHLLQNPETLPAIFIKAAQAGWQLAVDCTGDAALDQLLNCYQKAQFKTDIHSRRFIISHAAFLAEQDWSVCQELGLGAEMEPAELYLDAGSLSKTMGEGRLGHFLAAKSSFENKLIVGGGSDHRFEVDPETSTDPWNPWLGMWIMLSRKTDSGVEIVPDEKLSRQQAIRFYTSNNAWMNFEETKLGSLETGKLADMILVDQDLMKCPVEKVRQTKVLLTMVGGKVVWEAK